MRYSAQHKQETRERIVRAASRHFRRRGGTGIAISDLMAKLDQTHGGLYKHYDKKEQLLTEAISKAFDETENRFTKAVSKAKPGSELRAYIEDYLSLEHCGDPSTGCPMAALASEIGRLPKPIRAQVNQAMKRRVQRTAQFLPGTSEKERARNSLALISGLIGALSIARALVDPEERKAVLEASKDFYIKSFCT